MTDLDRLWFTVALAHGSPVGPERRPGRDEIDLTRRPAFGRGKKGWVAYVTALVQLVEKAAHGRSGVTLEYSRFLTREPR